MFKPELYKIDSKNVLQLIALNQIFALKIKRKQSIFKIMFQ